MYTHPRVKLKYVYARVCNISKLHICMYLHTANIVKVLKRYQQHIRFHIVNVYVYIFI